MSGQHKPQAVAAAQPIAVRLGFTDVSVVRGVHGWAGVAWSSASGGPFPITQWCDLATAIDEARAYEALSADRLLRLGGLTDPGGDGGLIHVLRKPDGLEVHHQARGGSWGYLRQFALGDEKRAVRFALSVCGDYSSRLGKLELSPANDRGDR